MFSFYTKRSTCWKVIWRIPQFFYELFKSKQIFRILWTMFSYYHKSSTFWKVLWSKPYTPLRIFVKFSVAFQRWTGLWDCLFSFYTKGSPFREVIWCIPLILYELFKRKHIFMILWTMFSYYHKKFHFLKSLMVWTLLLYETPIWTFCEHFKCLRAMLIL